MDENSSRYKDLGPLQELLLECCPDDARGKKSIPSLAKALGVTHQYIYRWISDGVVPAKFAAKCAELSGGKRTLVDFHPYLF